jgi:hypothetical protein
VLVLNRYSPPYFFNLRTSALQTFALEREDCNGHSIYITSYAPGNIPGSILSLHMVATNFLGMS